MNAVVYTDGSGTTGGPAGIAYVALVGGKVYEGSMRLGNATNQQAEILAAALGLHELNPCEHVTIVSDSEYVVKGMNEWMPGWINRGWKTGGGRRVKNLPHWHRLIEACERHGRVEFEWCRGHAGNEHNERADVLAGERRREALDALALAAATA